MQTIHAQLGIVAGLAIGFNAESGLEFKTVGEVAGLQVVQCFAVEDIDDDGCFCFSLQRFGAGDNDFIQYMNRKAIHPQGLLCVEWQ